MTSTSPLDLIAAFSRGNVCVVGDLILDEYVEGRVGRVSPEAPVPVVNVGRSFSRLGGAANVAHGLSVLGARAQLAGVIGADDAGARLLALCTETGVGTAAVATCADRPTTRKLRVLAQRQQLLRMDWERTDPIALDLAPRLEALIAGEGVTSVVLSDYAKGVLGPRLVKDVVAMSRRAGVVSIVDPKSSDFARYAGATVITPNLRELEAACGRGLEAARSSEIASVSQALLDRIDVEWLLVTLGERGMILVGRGGEMFEIAARAREVFDVTGAGDTVVAVLALALGVGADMRTAATLANAAAGVVVGKVGTAVVTAAEIAAALDADRATKVVDRAALSRRAAEWRQAGKKIVFTNGCFDLLHAGHVRLLQRAAAEGDVLVVGLNSDQSVKRLKGDERPIIKQLDRAALLAALDCVSLVTIFDEDTPRELIAALLPDVLVKGSDYRLDTIVGRDLVESHGGRAILVPLVPGVSTTTLVAALRAPPGRGSADGSP